VTKPAWVPQRFRFVTTHVLVVGGVYLGKVEEYDPAGYPGGAPPPAASVFAPQYAETTGHPTVAAGKAWCEQIIRELFLQTLDFAEGTQPCP